MASRIQGITVEIGGDTTKLTTALKGVNSEIRNTQSQLRDVEKLLKLNPGNTELLSQKQRMLNAEVQATKEKLEVLKTASEPVCNMEIWCECFGRDSAALKKIDSYEISGIMRKIEGWTKYTLTKNGVAGFSIYGKQRAYIREQDKK